MFEKRKAMKKKLGKRFWAAMLIFGLVGQIAWVVENMYFNVFIYKMFRASAAEISLMVSASSVAATVTTILMGALSDRIGKRKLLICGGYILWGISILSFALIRVDVLTPFAGSASAAASMGVTLVILMDCVMTFFGSTANDAAYNAWLTDQGSESDRGRIEGFNSMMPLLSILVVFGGFMGFDLEQPESWTIIYLIIGGVVLVIGLLGIVLIEESPVLQKGVIRKKKKADSERVIAENIDTERTGEAQSHVNPETSYWATVRYSFRLSVLRENKLLYAVLGAFALFGISIQTYMPYLILYYEQSLGMTDYVLIMAPAIVLAAAITAWYGRVYDMQGFKGSVIPSVAILMIGYVILFFTRTKVPVFIGSLLMMTGYMTGMAVFGAMIRDRIPQNRAGQFQGIRIIGQVLIPGIIGPAIGAFVLRDAEQIVNQDGTTSFLPHEGIWAAAFGAAVVLCAALVFIFRMVRLGHHELWSESGEELMGEEMTGKEGDRSTEPVSWSEHPRPQMKREKWQTLNGVWKLNGQDIRVPFPPQSQLSGYQGKVGAQLEYERTFAVPSSFNQERILLHFDAVDQITEIWLNGEKVGRHEGGYLPFAFDVTDRIRRDQENCLLVKVTDRLSLDYPYGKQCKRRGGMWYTPVSGIWKPVWLENVPERYIQNIKITPNLRGIDLTVEGVEELDAVVSLENGETVTVHFGQDGAGRRTCSGRIELAGRILSDGSRYEPTLWTPETPHLYPIIITSGSDRVESYFALRTIGIENRDGIARVCLNGEPIFMHGVLDQGYFCDGIYLPAREEEYDRDVLRMKELGYNMLRKHIKVEPEAFYYACDRLGMLVMQDMVNNGPYNFIQETALPTFGFKKKRDDRGKQNDRRQQIFLAHMEETIADLYNHPSIVAYTIFNEGWGQFHSDAMYRRAKELDPTRLADSTSGWFAQMENDFDSEHIYFKVISLTPGKRPLFVTECGGYSMPVEGHCYSKYNQYGYGACKNSDELTGQIEAMYRQMILPSISAGVCGCIYTQLSDVEDEINGLYTYDRRVCKVNRDAMMRLGEELKKELQS